MTGHRIVREFVVGVAVTCVVLVALTCARDQQTDRPTLARPHAPTIALVTGGVAEPHTAPARRPDRRPTGAAEDSGPGRAHRSPLPHAAAVTARRFVRALLVAEVGRRDRRTLAVLRATGATSLAAQLVAHRPRPIHGVTPERGMLGRLEPVSVEPGLVQFAATVTRGRRATPLLVTVRRGRRGWRASDLD